MNASCGKDVIIVMPSLSYNIVFLETNKHGMRGGITQSKIIPAILFWGIWFVCITFHCIINITYQKEAAIRFQC
jgi:hypothetical protein